MRGVDDYVLIYVCKQEMGVDVREANLCMEHNLCRRIHNDVFFFLFCINHLYKARSFGLFMRL